MDKFVYYILRDHKIYFNFITQMTHLVFRNKGESS